MKPALTFGSLFAGIGGFDLGFERAGLTCKWQVEIDPYANRVLEKHWPHVRRHDDVRTFPPEGDWGVDVICGGFPCQDISYAGRGAGLSGERSGLFYEAMRVVGEVGPRFVVLENVAALLTRGMDQVLGTLASFGFDAEWHVLPAAAFGAPHIRERVFIIGTRNGSYSYSCGLRGGGCGAIEAATPGDQGASKERQWVRTHATAVGRDVPDANSKGLERWPQANPGASGSEENTERARVSIERLSWWAAEPDVGRVANGVPKRVDRLRSLGNAVVPQVAEWIGRRLMEATA